VYAGDICAALFAPVGRSGTRQFVA